jgi:tetratricopeptide (TPR) repeat protein
MRHRLSKFVLFVLITGMLAAPRGGFAADKWLSVRTTNFLLVGNASESAIKRVARNLEDFRHGFTTLFPSVVRETAEPITVIVFKDDAAFRPFKPVYQGKPANIAGFFQAGSDANFIALSADMQTPHVIYHEFVHSLTKDIGAPLPAWASEGLAEFYAMFEVDSNGKEMLLGRAMPEHVVLLKQSLLALETLFSVTQGSPFYNEKTKQGVFYAESWALVHYLMLGNNGQRRPQFSKYLNLLWSGKSIDESFREAFQTEYKVLEGELRNYMGRLAFPAIRYKLREKLDFDREARVASLSEAQGQYYLGDLLLHMNRLDAAEVQLQKAISLDPKFAPSYASMGLLRVRQDRDEEALKFLTQAVQADSDNYMAHYYYAFMLQGAGADQNGDRTSRFQLARTHAKRAIELSPAFVEGYRLLGYIALTLRDEGAETQELIRKAVNLVPGRQELRLLLAQLMMMNGEVIAARVMLTPLKNLAADDLTRQQAERLLEAIASQQESEQAFREYQERRKAAEQEAEEREALADEDFPDEAPRLTRNETADTSTDSIVETAIPRLDRPAGPQIEGMLTMIDCSRGLTLRVRVGNGHVELHTNTPEKLEFMSYVAGVSDSIVCGTLKPELPVVIVYRSGREPRFLGEPIRVDFVEKK